MGRFIAEARRRVGPKRNRIVPIIDPDQNVVAGSAYLVSPETAKRVRARRYP